MSTAIITILITFILFVLIFTAFEAFDRLSGGRIMKLEETDPDLASRLNSWLEKSDSIRAVFKLCLSLLTALLGMSAYIAVSGSLHISEGWQQVFICIAIILCWALGELLCQLLLWHSDILILRVTIPWVLAVSRTILLPFTWLSNKLRENVEDWQEEEDPEQKVSTEDEILSVVENYGDHENDDLEEGEKRMIKGILDLGDMSVREIMTPRVDITAVPATATVNEAKRVFLQSGHSRIPVYGRSVDEIRGIIYAKDFIDDRAIAGKNLDQLSHKPLFIPESKAVGDLLEEIRRLHNHFAVIIDEYGGTSGIVTFEDIIEEIVGDVQDEYDNEEEEKFKPQLLPDGQILFEARTPISDVNEILDCDIPDTEEADTIGGYICAELGRIPESGEEFTFKDCGVTARIVRADKRKIQMLKIRGENKDKKEQ